jgi:hypothetical protein
MKSRSIPFALKATAIASMAAVLAACGGGSSSSPPMSNPDIPFGSSAVFVPTGQSQIVVPLSNCSRTLPSATTVTSASLTITSAGSLIFSAAVGTATSVATVIREDYSEANDPYWEAGVNPKAAYAYLKSPTKQIDAYYRNNGSTNVFLAKDSTSNFECTLTNGSASFTLSQPISPQRIADKMLAGITSIDTSEVNSGALSGGVASWDNWDNTTINSAQASVRYLSLNMSTGQLTGSPASSLPPSTPTVFSSLLPSNTSTYGYYYEYIEEGVKKASLVTNTPSTGAFEFYIERIANALRPISMYFD